MTMLRLLLIAGWITVGPAGPYASAEASASSVRPFGSPDQTMRNPEGPLTLQQAIDTALANNPEVAARGGETRAAQARRDRAFGARLPRFGITGGYTHTRDALRLFSASKNGEPGLYSRDIGSGDLVVSMPIFTGGRLVNQVKAADLLRQAASQQLARSREELVFNVSSAFNTILAQRHVIAAIKFSRKTLTEHLDRMEALIEAQKAAKVDRMRTEVRLADIEQRWVLEKNLLAIQQRALANLLGLKNFEGTFWPRGDLEMLKNAPLPDLDTALSKALEARGDYLAARAALGAREKSVDVAKSGHWPTLSVQGAYGGRWAAGPTTGSGDERGEAGRVGLVLEMPIFEGGQVDADIREQQANLAAARERLRSMELQVRLEVETALLNVESSGERAAAIRKSIAQAKESLRIERLKYDLGKGAIVDVLDAQSALLASETTYYGVLADLHTGLAQLRLAMGEE